MAHGSLFIPGFLISAVVTGTVIGLVACSGSSGGNAGSGADASTVTKAQAATDVTTALCKRYETCTPTVVQLLYGTEQGCESRAGLAIGSVIGANGSVVTPEQFEVCAKAIAAASCADVLGRKLPAECKIAGTLADGKACAEDAQCVNRRCKTPPNTTCGVCASHAAAGGACAVDDDCDDAMHCVQNACVLLGASGAVCDDKHPCNPTLGCVAGVCGPPAAAGADCSASSAACDNLNGIFCNPATKKCVPLQLVPPAAECGLLDAGLTLCQGPGSDCAGLAGKGVGTCAAAAADGTSCAVDGGMAGGAACQAPAVCANGTCTIPDPGKCM